MLAPVIATFRARSTCWYKAFNCAVPNESPFSQIGVRSLRAISFGVSYASCPPTPRTRAWLFFIDYWQVAMKPFTVDNWPLYTTSPVMSPFGAIAVAWV